MRVLVTGATGFIGRYLLRELERSRIRSVASPRRELTREADWSSVVVNVDAVIHLAAMAHERSQHQERRGDYETLRRANALATEALARAAAHSGAQHFVFLSTIGVYGDETFGVSFTEESPVAPRSLYAASKLEAERLLGAVSANTGLRLTILQPTLVYGPGNAGNMLRLLRLIDRGWPLPFGAIHNRRSLTYVGNLVAAIIAALTAPQSGGTFIVCDDTPVSTPALIRSAAAGMGRTGRLFRVPGVALQIAARLSRQQETLRRLMGSLEADAGKLSRTLGWQPTVHPHDGLYETGSWFRSENQRARRG